MCQLVHSGGGFNLHHGHGDSVDTCGCYGNVLYGLLSQYEIAAATELCVIGENLTKCLCIKGWKGGLMIS
jgi:hypothetical protein